MDSAIRLSHNRPLNYYSTARQITFDSEDSKTWKTACLKDITLFKVDFACFTQDLQKNYQTFLVHAEKIFSRSCPAVSFWEIAWIHAISVLLFQKLCVHRTHNFSNLRQFKISVLRWLKTVFGKWKNWEVDPHLWTNKIWWKTKIFVLA